MAKVILQQVTKVYKGDKNNDFVAVKDFNLEIEDREFMVFVGSSGCGKSTTLRMIAGLEEITAGEIFIGDRRINDVAPKDRDIAMVFQNYALYPHMSVYDNMAFGLKLRKFSRQEIKKRVSDAAAILGLTEMLDRKPKALSGGQRQRVAVGRAIVRQPKVFLFDEPLSNLDAKMRVQMRTELTHLHQRLDATMIYVTHDQVEAMTMGTRIVVMSQGEIQQVDAPLKLYGEPANLFVAGFLGSPPMNFIHGTLRSGAGGGLVFKEDGQGTVELNLSTRPAAAPFVDKKVILGVRPEDCTVLPPGGTSVQAFRAIVDLIEPMGAETYFHLQTGAHMLVSRNAGLSEPAGVGHRVQFRLDAQRAHLFDPVSTNRIV
jgi:multiple sugar transport system ATP-binding protein